MTKATRDVVVDLWPLYVSGEASADSRALVEAFLAQDAELAERLREPEAAGLGGSALALPADHERATLLRIQRRRARQSMIVNSLALVASLAMTAFYLWDLVPHWAYVSAVLGLRLPWAMSAAMQVSAWVLRLGIPIGLLLVPLAFLFRKHIKLPGFLESGTVVALATGLTLVTAQLCWLSLLRETSFAMETAYEALHAARH
jgi:anti-sigma factor RsiW